MSKKSAWSLYPLFQSNLYPFNLGMTRWFSPAETSYTTVDVTSTWVDPETNITVKPVSEIEEFNGSFPIIGSQSLKSKKEFGTCISEVQQELQYGVNRDTANSIACLKGNDAKERFGFAFSSPIGWDDILESQAEEAEAQGLPTPVTTYYDSVTGKPLFRAPVGRSLDDFLAESRSHGWPSFRDDEVVWENVRCLEDGEAISVDGTHLGHNLPDWSGNRYCINFVSIVGFPVLESDGE